MHSALRKFHWLGRLSITGARRRVFRVAATVVLATFSLAFGSSRAQGVLTTVLTNGPASNRVNLLVLSEGYTTNQLGQFLVDATNLVNNFLATMPYQEYRSYFNAYAISVASVQSGSDHPGYPEFVNTYFSSVYEFHDYYITIPPNGLDSNYANGQGKVDALVTNLLPQADIVMLLVNDLVKGGSSGLGGPNGTSNRRPIISALNEPPPFDRIPVHEAGHFFAGLVDEYTNAYPGYVPIEAPNSTKQTNRTAIKWNAWIDAGTPVPTPKNYPETGAVGLFEGAQYHTTGWYRPKLNCLMRDLYDDFFCEVCSEQVVKTIYQTIRPIDSFSPAVSSLTVYSAQPVSFSVTPFQPHTHDLVVQWYTNNVAVNGATNPAFQLQPRQLGNGAHSVRAVVRDSTMLVRNDPAGLLYATNTWSLTLSLNELRLTSPLYLSGERFRLTVTGTAPQGFVIQASTNLTNWTRLTTNSLSGGKFNYTNSGLGAMPFRYYRTVSPP